VDNLVLVGFSCSGKSTIGRILARRLRLRFLDTDKSIEQSAGQTIPDIFRLEGEATFRLLEAQAIAAAAAERYQVISTGGGAFVDSHNRDVLRNRNLVVHLRVRPETVVERLRNSRGGRPRPLLESPDPLKRVQELLAARRQAYAQAHFGVDVDDRPVTDLVDEIANRWIAWRRASHLPPVPHPSKAISSAS
jgi:shikimate kinase